MECHVIGYVSKIFLKLGRVPSKFDMIVVNERAQHNSYELKKNKKMMTSEICLNKSFPCSETSNTQSTWQFFWCQIRYFYTPNITQWFYYILTAKILFLNIFHIVQDLEGTHKTAERSVQVIMTHKFCSEAVQTNGSLVNKAISDIKSFVYVSRSPSKINKIIPLLHL